MSRESVKFVTPSKPAKREGFGPDMDTVQIPPSLLKNIWSAETHSKWPMSERQVDGFTGKSVRAIGFSPGRTTKRSCLPAASHRKATVLPSGDHAWSVGYLISAIRSMVRLPRGGSVAC